MIFWNSVRGFVFLGVSILLLRVREACGACSVAAVCVRTVVASVLSGVGVRALRSRRACSEVAVRMLSGSGVHAQG